MTIQTSPRTYGPSARPALSDAVLAKMEDEHPVVRDSALLRRYAAACRWYGHEAAFRGAVLLGDALCTRAEVLEHRADRLDGRV